MAELVKGKFPKGLEYIEKLLAYDTPPTWAGRIKQKFTGSKTEAHSISEWCRILNSSENNNHTREFLNYLEKQDALVEQYSEGEPPNETVHYSLDKNNLLEAVKDSRWWRQRRDLAFKIINKAEPNKKIVTDL